MDLDITPIKTESNSLDITPIDEGLDISPIGEESQVKKSGGIDVSTDEDAVDLLAPLKTMAEVAFTPLPGTQKLTDSVFGPLHSGIQMIQDKIVENPTTESIAAPLQTLLEASKYVAGTIAKGGVTPFDAATAGLAAGKLSPIKTFLGQDLIPEGKVIGETLRVTAKDIHAWLAPASVSAVSGRTATVLRGNLGEMANKGDIVQDSLKSAREYFLSQQKEKNLEFIDRMENGIDQATPHENQIAETLNNLFADRVKEVRRLGTGKLKNVIDNYFPHLWEQNDKATDFFRTWAAKRPFEGRASFLKKRIIPTLKEGIEAGLTPVTTNPIDATIMKIREMDKYIMAHKTLNTLKDEGIVKFFKIGKEKPAGWIKLDDRLSTVYSPVKTPTGASQLVLRGNYYAPAEAARVINNYLSPGLRSKPAFQAYLTLANHLNQAQLGISAFHLGFTSMDAIVSKSALGLVQLSHGEVGEAIGSFLKSPFSPVTNALHGDKLLKAWYAGDNIGAMGKMVKALQMAGGRVQMDRFYATTATDRMKEAFASKNYIGTVLRAPFALVEQAAKPVMEYIVPRQKLGVFMDLAGYEMKRLEASGASENVIAQKLTEIWDSVDNRMGQLVYDNLFWNKTTKDLGMASIRSLGWNTGTIRELGGGAVDTAKYISGKGDFTYKMTYSMSLPITAGIYGAMLNYLYTGEHPKELKDYYFPRTGRFDENGDPERISLPTYMKDVYAYKYDALKTAKNKLHPGLSFISQMLDNEDYYGVEIRNKRDPAVAQGIQVSQGIGNNLMPFGIRGMMREHTRGNTGERLVAPFFGIVPAPGYINKSEAENLAGELISKRIPSSSVSRDEFKKNGMRNELIKAIRNSNKQSDRVLAFKKLKESYKEGFLDQKDIRQIYRKSVATPLEVAVRVLPILDTYDVYKAATTEEKAQIKNLIINKFVNSLNGVTKQEMEDIYLKGVAAGILKPRQ